MVANKWTTILCFRRETLTILSKCICIHKMTQKKAFHFSEPIKVVALRKQFIEM